MSKAETSDLFPNMKDLNNSVNVQEFCKSRIDEILMLTEALKESPYRGQAFQRLPLHMRRRQMSHYIKRLPRRLRNTSQLSTQEEGAEPHKRPSRKFRRRPGNLLLEYNRRQKKSFWLETHIWHARRFHMTSKWGYRLPEKPTNKSFRACYRAITKHCFITDISYHGVIELHGQEIVLLQGLQQCVSGNCGLTFAAKMFISGSREGFLTMYHPNSYPYGVVGEVSFLWKPVESEEESRTIWINAHPTIYNEIIKIFKMLFRLNGDENLEKVLNDEFLSQEISHGAREKETIVESNKLELKSKAKNGFHCEVPTFINEDGSVTMKILKDKLNRIRLIGPLSLAILSNAFEVPKIQSLENVSHLENDMAKSGKLDSVRNPLKRDFSEASDGESKENIKRMKMDERSESVVDCKSKGYDNWFHALCKNEFRKRCLENQATFYKELAKFLKPSDVPPGLVLSLIVKDPRLTIPSKRMKCTPNIKDLLNSTGLTSLDPFLCYSSLWEPDIIEWVRNRIPTAEINRARAKLIVPGSDVEKVLDADKQAKVPLIIIQQTGHDSVTTSDRYGFGSGFDIIVPPGWSMPVWLSLIYRGARPGGLRETESFILESRNIGQCVQPDSRAGKFENLERYKKLKDIYFKLPPNKRPNFAKIGVQSPFYYPWEALVNDWRPVKPSDQSQSDLKFFVLRDSKKLWELHELLRKAVKQSKSKQQCIDLFELNDMNCLVPISLESCGKGTPKENGMVCLPTLEDLKKFKYRKLCPSEIQHDDPHLETRKLLKFDHTKILKSLKRKRRISKLRKAEENRNFAYSNKIGRQESSEEFDRMKMIESKDIVDKYHKKMEGLWLREPATIHTVMNSCSRPLLGYVVLGGFSFSLGNGLGLGYVTLHGLLSLLQRSFKEDLPPFVLFRNNDFVKYRFAKMQICTNKEY